MSVNKLKWLLAQLDLSLAAGLRSCCHRQLYVGAEGQVSVHARHVRVSTAL
jgi:hypothetical protein